MRLIDLHQDTLARAGEPGVDLIAGAPHCHVDLPRLTAAGVRAVVWAACDEFMLNAPESAARVLRMLAAGRDTVERSRGGLQIVRSRADLAHCLGGGAIGVLLAIEGGHSLLGSLEMLTSAHALGVRVLTLTWNHANPFASGCATGAADGGLTALGRELLGRANELGVVIDLAHASPRTLAAALGLVRRPFLVSHTACAALTPHRRNLSDAQLRAIAAAGGVIGIMLYPPFLASRGSAVTRATVAAHIGHAVAVAGEEAVAIGTDLDGMTELPMDVTGIESVPGLLRELERSGLAPRAIERVAWQNAARVLDAALGED